MAFSKLKLENVRSKNTFASLGVEIWHFEIGVFYCGIERLVEF